MPYIPPEIVAKAREMDLLAYLETYEPHELVRVGGNEYSTRTHGSLKISNGLWNWHSPEVGGRSALDFLIKVRGMHLTEAVEHILGRAAVTPPISMPSAVKEKIDFALPPQSPTSKRMSEYLQRRGIDPDIIKHCYDLGLLYESYPYGNAVFVGRDETGTARYAALRGAKFMGEVGGSQKRYSFRVPAAGASGTVHLFESPIDLLSYATLMKRHRRDPWQDDLLSLSGISKLSKTLPVALERHLEQKSDVQRIVCRFDNDETGHGAAAGVAALLDGRCAVESRPPPSGKDYNEYLIEQLNLQRNRKRELER